MIWATPCVNALYREEREPRGSIWLNKCEMGKEGAKADAGRAEKPPTLRRKVYLLR